MRLPATGRGSSPVGAVGLSLPRKVYYEKELTFLNSRSYGPGRYDPLYEEGGVDYPIGYVRWTEGRNLEAFVDLLASGQIDVRPMISHRFPIDQAPEAYDTDHGAAPGTIPGRRLDLPGQASRTVVGRADEEALSARCMEPPAGTPC